MAEMTIRLETDPVSGKKNIIVDLSSDADLLPHEHEEQHRALVEKLIEGGVVSAAEVGQVIVEREEAASKKSAAPVTEPTPQRESQNEGA